jgi:hypothetical protein
MQIMEFFRSFAIVTHEQRDKNITHTTVPFTFGFCDKIKCFVLQPEVTKVYLRVYLS